MNGLPSQNEMAMFMRKANFGQNGKIGKNT